MVTEGILRTQEGFMGGVARHRELHAALLVQARPPVAFGERARERALARMAAVSHRPSSAGSGPASGSELLL